MDNLNALIEGFGAVLTPMSLLIALLALAIFIALQGIFWMRAKNRADDDYLMSRMTDDDAQDPS